MGMPPMGMPPGGMMGGMPPGGGMEKPAEQREKYQVFVSKISDIDDSVVSRLLNLCGVVLGEEWPQQRNPRDGNT